MTPQDELKAAELHKAFASTRAGTPERAVAQEALFKFLDAGEATTLDELHARARLGDAKAEQALADHQRAHLLALAEDCEATDPERAKLYREAAAASLAEENIARAEEEKNLVAANARLDAEEKKEAERQAAIRNAPNPARTKTETPDPRAVELAKPLK